MKVSMNNIGNYTPQLKLKTEPKQKFNLEVNQSQKIKEQAESSLTPEEKKFFMGLYPESKNEIVDYHFYQKSGKMTGVKIGSNLDRRG